MANRGGWKSSSEYRVHVRVNSQGLRGPEIPYAKPEGVQRVLVLGDSFTFGAQVDEEQTFVARLGEHLRAGTAASDLTVGPIETINAGVDGWTTINQVTWLQAEGLRYAPDLVVLMYYTGNDPGENYDYVKALGRVGAVPVPSAEPSSRSVQHFLLDRSHAYTAFETGVLQKLRPAEEPADLDDEVALNVRRSADPERKAAGWELSGDLIRQLRALCDERGIRLVVVGIPTVEHVINVDREPTPIRAISERAGVPVVDLLDAFRAAPGRALGTLYFPKDRHWTPAGHELAATEMAAVIAEMDLIRTATDRSLTR